MFSFLSGPTRSLSSALSKSRPQSERSTLPSARDQNNMAADMSVLYDQEVNLSIIICNRLMYEISTFVIYFSHCKVEISVDWISVGLIN